MENIENMNYEQLQWEKQRCQGSLENLESKGLSQTKVAIYKVGLTTRLDLINKRLEDGQVIEEHYERKQKELAKKIKKDANTYVRDLQKYVQNMRETECVDKVFVTEANKYILEAHKSIHRELLTPKHVELAKDIDAYVLELEG